MAIPKQIFQTFKTKKLPFISRFHIWNLKRKNPEYSYSFYDDEAIDNFIKNNFEQRVFSAYKKLKIGASKADFFRYAILYKKGGVYLDIDSLITTKIDNFILPTDEAVVALEKHLEFYCQWALFFNSGHPFLKQIIDDMVENIENNNYPKSVHKTTGPTAFTIAIKKIISNNNNVKYREIGPDYDNHAKFSYPMSKFFIYGFRKKNHWKNIEKKLL
jgi:inositol phosphorylceramide mannosyltransferase catalytic subunit